MTTVISVENLSKSYRLGQITGKTLTEDLNRWWARVRKQPDPYRKIGQKDLSSRRGEELWALNDVSLTVNQGEVLGIIGRNGAGKSTLLKILSQVTAPTSGVVKIKGRIASLLEVGTGFHPELTGRENIYLNGAILGMTRNEVSRQFSEIVEFAEVEEFIDTPVKRYSSGMYVRLAFAVAAHLEPEILVVDEVLAVGDMAFQKKCLGKMDNVAKAGRTVLFVSHNMAAVENLCSRGIVLENGKIIFDGEISEVINSYINISRETKTFDKEQKEKFIRFVNLVDVSGNPLSKLKIGEPMIFQIGLGPHPQFVINIGIGINNNFKTRVTTVQTQYSGYSLPATNQSQVIECRIENLALAPGEYGIKVATASTYGQDLGTKEENSVFEIVASDFWKHGHLPSPRQGIVLADHRWRLIE